VFPVKYELNFYILFSTHLVFKGLKTEHKGAVFTIRGPAADTFV
jgi:hypothetical protein